MEPEEWKKGWYEMCKVYPEQRIVLRAVEAETNEALDDYQAECGHR